MTSFLLFRCSNCCKSTSLSTTAGIFICSGVFWSDSKEESFSQSWSTRTDSLHFSLPMLTLKLSECKQVELSAGFIAVFSNFNSFCSTWVVSASFYAFDFSSLNFMQSLKLLPKNVLPITNFHSIT